VVDFGRVARFGGVDGSPGWTETRQPSLQPLSARLILYSNVQFCHDVDNRDSELYVRYLCSLIAYADEIELKVVRVDDHTRGFIRSKLPPA
jgi:hypothetical protein